MIKQQLINQIGFTTQTFIKHINDKSISVEELIEWASNQDFKWVELRDPQVKLTKKYLKKIKSFAEQLGININYAWDGTNILNPEDEPLIIKGIGNAAVFGKGSMSRILIAPSNIMGESNKLGYSSDELLKITKTIAGYNKVAAEYGVALVYENSCEPLFGDEVSYFGMADILKESPDMKITFDSANCMNKDNTRLISNENEVISFCRRFCSQIPYMHVKSTENSILKSNLLLKADLNILNILKILNDNALVCVELPSESDLELCKSKIIEGKNLLIENLT